MEIEKIIKNEKVKKILKEKLNDKNFLKKGLKEEEVNLLIKEFGYNEIKEKEENLLKRLLKKLWGPIPWMIEFALFLSFIIKRYEDFFVILTLLVVNVFVEFWQEYKATNALKILKEKLAKKSLVLREGKWKEIEAKYLVPGDIIKLKIGDIVPADVILLEGVLEVDQSVLTGESKLVEKKRNDLVYSNSIIKEGEGVAIVVGTGINTFFGETVKLVAKAEKEEKSHFQKMVIKVGNYLTIITIILTFILVLFGLYRHESFIEIIRFSLILTIAAIPVALPVVLTVTMAIGALELSKKKAIVSRLPSIEELAGVDVLCSDKTGTLTMNKMSISSPVIFDNIDEKTLIFYAALASKEENQDPLETPLFDYLKKEGLYEELKKWKTIKFVPFNPKIKRTEAIVEKNGEKIEIIKGAPQVILSMSNTTKKEEIVKKIKELAKKQYRVIAVAIKKEKDSKFKILGLIPFYDPPRPDSKEAIDMAKSLGIKVKMITGDNIEIARNIAKLLGIGEKIYNIKELKESDILEEYVLLSKTISEILLKKLGKNEEEAEKISEEITKEVKKILKDKILPGSVKKHESQIIEIVEKADGFAEVLPEDKYFIVEKLQKKGHIVGMTGDGVNDAPALKKADCGIAVNNATDAARSAADIVLLTPGLKVIIDAIILARKIFRRMESYVIYRITETIRILIFVFLSILIFKFYPITAIMIVLLALLNDIPIIAIAFDNVEFSKEPIRWNIFEILFISTILGITGLITSFTILILLIKYFKLPVHIINTIVFLKLLIAGHLTIFVSRSKSFCWKKPFPSITLVITTLLTVIIGCLIALFGLKLLTPVNIKWVMFIIVYALLSMFINDLVKVWTYNFIKKHHKQSKIN